MIGSETVWNLLGDEGSRETIAAHALSELFDPKRVDQMSRNFEDALASGVGISALECYNRLERCTLLFAFHTYPRSRRNLYYSGIVQSYGDHNRLLALGLDKLLAGDIEWYLRRRCNEALVEPDTMRELVERYLEDLPSTREFYCLSVAGALHDFGKVWWRTSGSGLDAEDAPWLARPLLARLLREAEIPAVEFLIQNHDAIEHVLEGVYPRPMIAKRLASVTSTQEDAKHALASLGAIQLAGAASLGEGRVTPLKCLIFDDCVRSTILDDLSPLKRLESLVGGNSKTARNLWRGGWREHFLERVVIHGWREVTAFPRQMETKMELLESVARAWNDRPEEVEHVLLSEEVDTVRLENLLDGRPVLLMPILRGQE